MRQFFWLASAAACMVVAGCAEPAGSASGAKASFEFVDDAGFETLIADQPVVVVNFTADW